MSARRVLSGVRAPDEDGAEARAWNVVRSAYQDRVPGRRRHRIRLALLPVLALFAGAAALSPAGARVARWVRDTLGVRHAASKLAALPSPGRVLVSGPHGTWIVSADGSLRRLGPWSTGTWSPHGLYVAVTGGMSVAAADPRGRVQWSLSRPKVADPSWYPPNGWRVAYLAGGTVRVVAGDGADDHLLARDAARVAPAWRPGHPYELAYVTRGGRLIVRAADSGRMVWSTRPRGQIQKLGWSIDGARLLVLTHTRADVYLPGRRLSASIRPAGAIVDGSLAPDGRRLALVVGRSVQRVLLASIASGTPRPTVAFTGAGLDQVDWSPDGRWLLVSWPAADQWVFVHADGRPLVAAVSHIAQQFGAGPRGRGFPRLAGWCCARWPR